MGRRSPAQSSRHCTVTVPALAQLAARLGPVVLAQPIGGAPTVAAAELKGVPLGEACQATGRGALRHARELHLPTLTDRTVFA